MKLRKTKTSGSNGGRGDCAPCNGQGGVRRQSNGEWVECARCRGTGSEPS